jgi:GT2 family glycosyltransferase
MQGVVYLRNEKNSGFIFSCNRGAAPARGKYLFFLNNDTIVTPGWLTALLATFVEDPQAGIVGSKLVYPWSVTGSRRDHMARCLRMELRQIR